MQRIIIIDDSKCKHLLEDFLNTLSGHVKFDPTIGNDPLQKQLLLECIKDLPSQKKIPVKSNGNIYLVNSASIFRVEANDEFSSLHFSEGRILETIETIDQWQDKLRDFGFLRVHKNHLVSISQIERMQFGAKPFLTLANGEEIPVDLLIQQQIAGNIEEML